MPRYQLTPDGDLRPDGAPHDRSSTAFANPRAWRRVRALVMRRDRYRCRRCGRPGTRPRPGAPPSAGLEAHHLTPREVGGLDVPENLVTLCRVCHDRADADWRREQGASGRPRVVGRVLS